MKVVYYRGKDGIEDDDGKCSDASSIRKCGSSEICSPCVRTAPPLVRTLPSLVCTPPLLAHTPPHLISTFSSDDCLFLSVALGGMSNLLALV